MTRDAINFSWLVRLRWAAIAGQLVTILTVRYGLGIALSFAALLTVIAVEAATNLACVAIARRAAHVREWWSGVVLIGDVVFLTALLHLAGGPFNPFSFLYLVEIAIAAAVLRAQWTWTLVAVALGCSGALFVTEREAFLAGASHAEHMTLHLRGMWVAFGVAATFIVYFLMRVRRDLEARERELAEAELRATRQARLAGLATLAAGAAHELATPLGTIAVVTRELERHLERALTDDLAARDDVRLIRAQVERCKDILDAMAADAGQSAGETPTEIELGALLDASRSGLREVPPIRVELGAARTRRVRLPARAVAQALKSLLKNAQDASPEDRPIEVSATLEPEGVRIEIADHGAGMATETLNRVGEPFFTTKDPGRGMGLGVFLTRAVLERVGGELVLESRAGAGTRARVRLPCSAAQIDRMDEAVAV